jgi:hypothetical protein
LKILELLEAVWAPQKVSAIHCPGNQKGKTLMALGNQRADQEVHAASGQDLPAQPVTVTAALLLIPLTECVPHYSSHECKWFTQEEGKYFILQRRMVSACRWVHSDSRDTNPTFVNNAHWDSHMGKLAHKQLLSQHFYVLFLPSLARNICKHCETYAKNNPRQEPLPKAGVRYMCSSFFEDLEKDFTELP